MRYMNVLVLQTITILQYFFLCVEGNQMGISESSCQAGCFCQQQQIQCEGRIPDFVPSQIEEVVLNDVNPDEFVPGRFCNTSWSHVRKLSIYSDKPDGNFDMTDYVFSCLNQIEILKLSFPKLVSLTNNSFSGLGNVTELDLSGCIRIMSDDISRALTRRSILPKLSKLSLVEVGRALGSIDTNKFFIKVLQDRRLQVLNMSSIALMYIASEFEKLCSTLEVLNISKVRFEFGSMFASKFSQCEFLELIDISGAELPTILLIPYNHTVTNMTLSVANKGEFNLYSKVRTLYANDLISSDHVMYLVNCSFICFQNGALTELHLSNNQIRQFDVKFYFTEKLEVLNLSRNKMEQITSRSLENLIQLRKIDLSNNKLSKLKSFENGFEKLFSRNPNLEVIDLSRNALTHLPRKTFSKNQMLTHIDLTGNVFRQIAFSVSHLSQLTRLDLRNNSIENLDVVTRQNLDKLFFNRSNENKSLEVHLSNNPFSCTCHSLEFISWFVRSPIFSATNHSCKLGGEEIQMSDAALAAARDDCERPKRLLRNILLGSILPAVTAVSCGILISVCVRRNRQKKYQQHVSDLLLKLERNEADFRFPVFLTFASNDASQVVPYVLNPLEKRLRQFVMSDDRDMVCYGDRHFRPGRSIFNEMITCLEQCCVVVCVLSIHYCQSAYCKLEIEHARVKGKPIILILLEEVDEALMNNAIKDVFSNFTRVKFVHDGSNYKLQPNIDTICESVLQLMVEH